MKVLFFLTTLILTATAFAAKQNTEDYWKCKNQSSGRWIFGEAPKACSASSFLSPSFIIKKYEAYIFDEESTSTTERIRYVSEMNSLISTTATYYLKKRKPSASLNEQAAWVQAIKAISHQESFISHYRIDNNKDLLMMRGDFGHGHGIMQIDDRWHFAAVNEGRAANLVDNLFYAMDIYYSGWEKAPSTNCVNGSSDYYNRTRAAYSAYNGGSASICRFTNPNHKWARNDSNFKDKFDSKTWERYVSSDIKTTPVDVNCLSKPNQICTTPIDPNLKKVQKYNGLLCAIDEEDYKCIEDSSLRFCLVNKFSLINEVINTSVSRPVTILSSEQACSKETTPIEAELLSVGDFVQPEKNINLRKTPGGLKLNIVNAGEKFQILDVKTIDAKNYYQVVKNGDKGYFYTGTDEIISDWSSKTDSAVFRPLPVAGDFVKIATPYGTNLRKTPGGTKISIAPKGATFEVLQTVFIKSTEKFYIKVNVNGETGFLYSGKTNPELTIDEWVEVLK